MEVRVRLARPKDSQTVVDLAAMALGQEAASAALAGLKDGVGRFGGRLPVPYGVGSVLVAVVSETVCGLIHYGPPVRWIGEHEASARAELALRVVEIELLAVSPKMRKQGVASTLLRAMEQHLHPHGVRLCVANVRRDNHDVTRWYRRHGFRVAPHGVPLELMIGGLKTTMVAADDAYQLACKPLTGPPQRPPSLRALRT